MRQHIIALFETIAQVVATLLEPFQFQTRKREQELALERLRTEATHQQLQLVLEHSAAINSDTSQAMLKVADGFAKWLELFKTQSLPEAHTHSEEDQWRVEQTEMRKGLIEKGYPIDQDPDSALRWFLQKEDEQERGGDATPLSAASQQYLDSLRNMRRAG